MNFSLSNCLFFASQQQANLPKVAISACLHGEAVRYDGSHKLLESTSTILSRHLRLIPICPEVGAGMSVPRPPIQLVESKRGLRARGRDNRNLDATYALDTFRQQSQRCYGPDLCGYILKSRSPSCGLDTTPVYNPQGRQLRLASGLQADYFRQQQPWLQMVDETALEQDRQCEEYIVRCLVLADVRAGSTTGALADLHRHYTTLVGQMTDSHRCCVESALASGDPQRYWQAFGIGLQALFQQPSPAAKSIPAPTQKKPR